MHRILIKKCLLESRLLLAACTVAVFLFCWARVWVMSLFDMSRFQAVIEQFREYERFSSVPFDQLFTYAGRIAVTWDEPIVVACVSLWAIARGSDLVSGELGRGTMEMVLAQPVSRLQVFLSHASVTIGGVAVIAGASWLGVHLGVMTNVVEEPAPPPTWTVPWLNIELSNPLAEETMQKIPLSAKVDTAVFAPAACNLFAFGFFLAGLTTLMSAWDRYRWRTIGVVVGFYLVQMTFKIVGRASDGLSWLVNFTFFGAYEPQRLVAMADTQPGAAWHILVRDAATETTLLGPLGYSLLLLGMGCAAYAAAAILFRRRDLPAPL